MSLKFILEQGSTTCGMQITRVTQKCFKRHLCTQIWFFEKLKSYYTNPQIHLIHIVSGIACFKVFKDFLAGSYFLMNVRNTEREINGKKASILS